MPICCKLDGWSGKLSSIVSSFIRRAGDCTKIPISRSPKSTKNWGRATALSPRPFLSGEENTPSQYFSPSVLSHRPTEVLCLVSTIPLPFFRSVATVAVAAENGNAENVFPYNIGMKWPERWLVVHLRQNGKNRIRPYCYGTGVRRNGRWQRQQRNGIFHVGNVILTALTLRNFYGICVMATAKRQRQNGNGMVETRH